MTRLPDAQIPHFRSNATHPPHSRPKNAPCLNTGRLTCRPPSPVARRRAHTGTAPAKGSVESGDTASFEGVLRRDYYVHLRFIDKSAIAEVHLHCSSARGTSHHFARVRAKSYNRGIAT